MQPIIPLAKYRFTYQAIDPVSLPAFADPLWRSVFGLQLKLLSCISDTDDCNGCQLRYQCDYSFLTLGQNPPEARTDITPRMKNIPNPHIFQSRTRDYTTKIPRGATFSGQLTLIGKANDRLPAVIRAMAHVGQAGLGRDRPKSRLLEVTQTGPSPLSVLIMRDQEISATGTPAPVPIPTPPDTVLFTFLTPYLLPSNTDIREGFNATKLIMQIIRRISSLQGIYTPTPLETDFKYLKS
ncbi:MAG: hypothetical protein GY934_04550, partial [Gammaproteobacteria bacterium]|nr:hypothetical protein [Gammaproteobacteria bacterium]